MNTTGNLPWILDLTNHQMNDENAIELASHLKTNDKINLLYKSCKTIYLSVSFFNKFFKFKLS